MRLRVEWRLIGAINAGHIRDQPAARLFVKTFGVSLLANLQRRINKHFDEVVLADQFDLSHYSLCSQ